MDMDLRAITFKSGIQHSARENIRAQHRADAALFPRSARVSRVQRSRGFVGSALIRLGGWLEIRSESPRQITPA